MAVLTISVERAPGKLSLTFADGVNRALAEQTLAEERRCCAFLQLGLLRCAEPRRAEASATLRFQMTSASSSNATASRRLADTSTASS